MVPRVAAEEASGGVDEASQEAVFEETQPAVFRTARVEAADLGQERAEEELVSSDGAFSEPSHSAGFHEGR